VTFSIKQNCALLSAFVITNKNISYHRQSVPRFCVMLWGYDWRLKILTSERGATLHVSCIMIRIG